MHRFYRFCALLLASTGLIMPNARALAADSGTVDASVVYSSHDSATNAYGPWFTEDLVVRLPPDGGTGIEFATRHAADRFNPNTEQSVQIDNYHRWNRAFTSYASAQFGSAAPYAQDRFALEGDVGAGRHLVAVAGYALGNQYTFGHMQQLTLGTDYYFGDDYVALRYRPTWSAGLGTTQTYSAALALGHPGRSVHTFRIGGGGENDASLINPLNPTLIGERTFDVGYSYKHWVSPGGGFHLDTGYGTLDRSSGGRIYSHVDFGVGYFFALR